MQWRAFERVFGPITLHERIDHAGALAAWGSRSAMGGKEPPQDFLWEWGGEEQTPQSMVAFLKSLVKRKRKRG